MMFKLAVPFLICMFASPLFATVKSVSVNTDTASRFETVAPTTTSGTPTYVIYGGTAGAFGGCSAPSGSVVCNSCTGLGDMQSGNFQCAERSIYGNLKLAMTITLDQLPANPQIMVRWADTKTLVFDNANSSISGTSVTVYIPWSSICAETPLGDCNGGSEKSGTGELFVGLGDSTASGFASGAVQKFTIKLHGVNPTEAAAGVATPPGPDREDPIATTGFSDFMVLPGDEKVYLTDIWRGATGPTGAVVKWQALRLYYVEDDGTQDFKKITYNGENYSDFNVTDKEHVDTSLDSNRLTGLENEKLYLFNIASVDEASIVTGFLNPALLAGTDGGLRYRARPGEVVGLLDNKECFIATAAFGSQMDDKVDLLRTFRNHFLSPYQLGRQFVRFYYQHSPPIAKYIAQHESLRTAVRWSLWPIIFIADISLNYGPLFAIAILIAAIGLTATLIVRIRRKA